MTKPASLQDDAHLLEAAAAGDHQAFAQFCQRSLPTLLRVIHRKCRDYGIPEDLAEDFGHEAILQGIKAIRKRRYVFSSPESITHFLITISVRLLTRWMKSRVRFDTTQRVEDQSKLSFEQEALDILMC